MKIYIPHSFKSEKDIEIARSGAMLSGFNHLQALSKKMEIYLPADDDKIYTESIFGIRPIYDTIKTSIDWFQEQNFDAILIFEPNVDNLTFLRHTCPAPIILRLSCCFGGNREFFDQVLSCYSLLRPFDAISPKSAWCEKEISSVVWNTSCIRPITNGIDLDFFAPMDKEQTKKSMAEQTQDDRILNMPIVGFSGRFEPAKGAKTFLSIADLNPDILFVIAGQQYAPISHPDNVIFIGHQPYKKMPNFYNAIDVLCFLSVYSRESCPSVILESMACECPVIATNFSGTPELLGNCGEIVAIENFSNEPLDISGYINPECVSLRLRELIKDEQRRKTLGKNARERAQGFSWDSIANLHVDLINELNARKSQLKPAVPITVQFAQRCDREGNLKALSRVFNFSNDEQGPLPRISFLGQDLDFLEGLGLYLSQNMCPNELEAVIYGIVQDRVTCENLIKKVEQMIAMLTTS